MKPMRPPSRQRRRSPPAAAVRKSASAAERGPPVVSQAAGSPGSSDLGGEPAAARSQMISASASRSASCNLCSSLVRSSKALRNKLASSLLFRSFLASSPFAAVRLAHSSSSFAISPSVILGSFSSWPASGFGLWLRSRSSAASAMLRSLLTMQRISDMRLLWDSISSFRLTNLQLMSPLSSKSASSFFGSFSFRLHSHESTVRSPERGPGVSQGLLKPEKDVSREGTERTPTSGVRSAETGVRTSSEGVEASGTPLLVTDDVLKDCWGRLPEVLCPNNWRKAPSMARPFLSLP
mmetsp:Transcript_107208/g.285257  ORF Transcript_107208/g.285257 Transcript_107208/m.285257 type:complete len:294 (+) Transcript_107208:3-884(+)